MFAIMLTFSLLMALAITIYTDKVVMKVLEHYDNHDDFGQEVVDHTVDYFIDNH